MIVSLLNSLIRNARILLLHYVHRSDRRRNPIARGAAPILLALIAFLTINERLSLLQIAAFTLTSTGILVLVVGKGGDWIAAGVAIATGISIAAYSFFGALGVGGSADVLGFQAWLEILTGLGMLSFITGNANSLAEAGAVPSRYVFATRDCIWWHRISRPRQDQDRR